MNTQTNTSAKITSPLHLIAGLTYTAGLSDSAATKSLLLNSARFIAAGVSAQRDGISKATVGLPQGHKLSDKAVRLLEHCLGLYDPSEADCPHFDGMTPPTLDEAMSLLSALQTSDVRLIPDATAHSASVAESADLNDVEPENGQDAVDTQQSSDLPFMTSGDIAEATRRIRTDEFFRAINGGASSAPQQTANDISKTTPVEETMSRLGIGAGLAPELRAALRQKAVDVISSKGPIPSNPLARQQMAVEVGSEFLQQAAANAPEGVDIKSDLREWHDHLGMHIQNGDIPASDIDTVTRFHAFVGSILANAA